MKGFWNFKRCITVKRVAFCFAALVLLALAPASHASEGTGTYLRIGLAYGAGAPSSCEITSANGFILAVPEGNAYREGMPLPAYAKLTVSASGGRILLHADGVLVSDDIGAGTCVLPHDYASGARIFYEGVPYRGGLSFRPNPGNTFNVINRLGVEEYLYGVVNSEMGYKNPAEALKAQAVAARSYSWLKRGAHADDGFDLCAGAHCQSYKGYSDEHAEIVAAVDATTGLMLYRDDAPVSGNYFKNSGGHTQNSEDVWSEAVPYLRGVPDEYSPPYSWGWQITFRELRTLLLAAGEDPGEIAVVSVSGRNADGSVNAMTIIGDRGTVVLEKNRIRTVLGASNVKSLRFGLGGVAPAPARAPAVFALGADGAGSLASNAFVLSADETGAFDAKDAFLRGAAESVRVSALLSAPGAAPPIEDEPATDGFVSFTGSGYGHGVGMPQDSAIEMAKQGHDFRRILTKYFTGVQVR
ncbi:MAG: SpoIID/LytB domain-containing protein [Clostridiales Family XIII bacterium]|jgi:stage II sporulation protein D|nr:SpoIID/LytB domain-containing protein [Clostridiales Family XIII bacterium]